MNSQEYVEVSIKLDPYTDENAEIMMAEICDLPFESFSNEDPYLKCYIQKELYDAHALKLFLSEAEGYPFTFTWSATLIPPTNWNAEWESHFTPIIIDNKCTIKATYHKDLPKTRFNITIDPKMAFGTGHHQTTHMMCRAIMAEEEHIRGKVVMDMGCGTAILSILCAKMKAAHVIGVDIDAVAAISAYDNARLNRCGKIIETYCGDASLMQLRSYDVILANINRNILLEDMPTYARSLRKEGLLLISGFYMEDLPMLQEMAAAHGLEFISSDSMENWCCAKFRKNA